MNELTCLALHYFSLSFTMIILYLLAASLVLTWVELLMLQTIDFLYIAGPLLLLAVPTA